MNEQKKNSPSMDQWLKEAKTSRDASKIGMFLTHNGVVRTTSRARVRLGDETARPVTAMLFSYDKKKMEAAIERAKQMEGIYYVNAWLNEGRLTPGDDIMYVLVGGDIRPHVISALEALVGDLKTNCVTETELYE